MLSKNNFASFFHWFRKTPRYSSDVANSHSILFFRLPKKKKKFYQSNGVWTANHWNEQKNNKIIMKIIELKNFLLFRLWFSSSIFNQAPPFHTKSFSLQFYISSLVFFSNFLFGKFMKYSKHDRIMYLICHHSQIVVEEKKCIYMFYGAHKSFPLDVWKWIGVLLLELDEANWKFIMFERRFKETSWNSSKKFHTPGATLTSLTYVHK